MRTSKLLICSLVFLLANNIFGQSRQEDTTSRYKSLIPEEKQWILKNVDIIANMNFDFRTDFENNEYLQSVFRFEQFRLEIKGYVTDRIFFRFRHRYTSDFQPQTLDKIIKGVDFAYMRFDLDKEKKWQLTVGKTFADWGGWEFDINPIEIYEYSDIIEYADNFLSGVGIYYQATPNHGFSGQVLNTRTNTFEELYDTIPDVTQTKAPLAGVINWRGSFFNGALTTLWSYSIFTEAKGFFKNYIALGQRYNGKKFSFAYDFKISDEQIDRTGIISDEIPDDLYNYSVKKTLYHSHWIRGTYKITPKWHISLDAFVDFADWLSDLDPLKTQNRFRTVYSFIPTVEFFPFDRVNLKFFLGYVGRFYEYSDYAKNRPGLMKENYNTGRIMFGVITPLKVL